MKRITYTTLGQEQTIFIEDPAKLVAELTVVNYGPFKVFDDCNWRGHFDSYTKTEFHHHSQFDVLYNADDFNRNGVLQVLKTHGFHPPTKPIRRRFEIEKNWLIRKCGHIFSTCEREGECDPDCWHFKFKYT
jgi:hypothetical protein